MKFTSKTEWGWNEDPSCVTNMRGGVTRLNCSKGAARIVSEAPIYLPGATIKVVLRGAPAMDPRVDKGIWIMFCDENGKETMQEFDLLELSRFDEPLGHSGWINYHEVSGDPKGLEMHGFDAGAYDEYEIESWFLIVNGDMLGMQSYVSANGKVIGQKTFVARVPHYGNFKIGCFALKGADGKQEFRFPRVADRGPLFIDVVSVEITRSKE